jgi:hypothetical protein
MIKQIYPETRRRWTAQSIARHKRKRSIYENVGDYNARELGINADFIFRQAYARWKHGHLYGRNYYGNVPAPVRNPNDIIFLTKHELRLIETLMNRGIIKK